ncbi:MAG: GTPase HflX [Amylibacter sp.]|nr:GTPase HflX [Amylibacter sp.]
MGAPETRVSVLHPNIRNIDIRRTPQHSLEEAVSLAHALELDVIHQLVVPLRKPQAGLLFGKGKLQELAAIFEAEDIGLVIIDGPVTPIQQRNLEEEWGLKVLDRTGLILEIFGDRAATREGVLQVDLAALSYQKTRLVRSWTHLERQRGGLSFVGGAGESQLESDRRALDDAIVRLKKRLAKVVKTRTLHRDARKKIPYPIVALVGYTNAGKSTIFNCITGASVMAKDMLFATLDPTMRAVTLPSGREIILSDTVGFISDLPTELVAAFRATLEEVLDADLILHVRDIAHPESAEQAKDVLDILEKLGIAEDAQESIVDVWNKIDILPKDQRDPLITAAERNEKIVATSAVTGAGIDALLEAIELNLTETTITEVVKLAFSEGKRRAWLFDHNVVDSEKQIDIGFEVTVTWTGKLAAQFEKV